MSRFMLVGLLVLATQIAWSAKMERGPVREVRRSLDFGNPQDENLVLRNGTIALNFTNYGVFGNDWITQSYALEDPCSGEWAPQFEYPEGSGAQYLWQGALWVGALIEEDGFFTTRVSVGTDGWQNPSINEFHAGAAPNNGIILRSNVPDAQDCFGNSIYDPSARANVEAVAQYSDTLTDSFIWPFDPVDGPHRPLGLEITQTARLWTAPEYARFVILDFEIENIGHNFLKNVTLGLLMDADVGMADEQNRHIDDISGSLVLEPQHGNLLAWSADNDGRRVNDPNGPLELPDAFGVAALSESDTIGGDIAHSFNWWNSNGDPDYDYGPAWLSDPQWDCDYGTPEGDVHKFHVMANRERDYDSYRLTPPTPQADTSFQCISDGEVHDWCEVETYSEQSDTRFLLSWDAVSMYAYTDGAGHCIYRLYPGERFSFSVAMMIGKDFHTEGSDEYNFDGLYESYNRAKFLYDSEYGFQPPTPVSNLHAVSASSGAIPLEWEQPEVGGVAGFRVFGRPDSGLGERVEFTTNLITDEQFTVNGLVNGDYWLIEVQTEDQDGNHSSFAEKMVHVGAIPMNIALSGATQNGVNTLNWPASDDPTFTFYRVERVSVTETLVFDNLTATTYNDDDVVSGRAYAYTLYLRNSLGITSLPSNNLTLTPFSPLPSILVYDETRTPTAIDFQRGAVADSLVRNWYESLLNNLNESYEYIDVATNEPPLTLETLAGHSIVIWHSENPKAVTSTFARDREAALRAYVALGGKLLRFGRLPLSAAGFSIGINYQLSQHERLLPLTFDSVFVNRNYNPNDSEDPKVVGAIATDGAFPTFSWDPAKVAALMYGGQNGFEFLPGVDLFWPNGNTWGLYTVVLHEEDSTNFDNAPCGVIGAGEIFFGFPLYFIPEEQAQDLLEASLHALRTQVLDTPEPPAEPLPTSIALRQNYPNPFNPSTTIEFDLPVGRDVNLRIYNVQGQLVETLMSGALGGGTHKVQFNGASLASGLYFYRLELGQESLTRKMLLLK